MPVMLEREGEAALHVGVRQVNDGGQVPVSVVSSTAGTTWEVELADDGTVLGTVTIGEDGTGTALVTIPIGTPSGVAEITATGSGEELTASVSVAGHAGAPSSAAPSASVDVLPAALGGGIAVLAAVALAVAVTLVARRRRPPRPEAQ